MPTLPNNKSFHVTVTAVNHVGLNVTGTSFPFRIDTSTPLLKHSPRLLRFECSPEGYFIHERSTLVLDWSFTDPESLLESHEIILKTAYGGDIKTRYWEYGNQNGTVIHFNSSEELSDGQVADIIVTACNAAGLCTSAKANGTLTVDSSPPHVGQLQDPVIWQILDGKFILNVTFVGFFDPHSGFREFCLAVGSSFREQDVSRGPHCFWVEDRFSDLHKVALDLLDIPKMYSHLYISYWAVNKAGLVSMLREVSGDIVPSNVAEIDGIIHIHNHSCASLTCNTDCTCSEVDKTCANGDPNYKKYRCHNSMNDSLSDMIKVIDGNEQRDVKFAVSSTCLQGHWQFIDNSSATFVRFEVSVGLKDLSPGEGIFDIQRERVWHDLGKSTSVTYCLPKPRHLMHGQTYIIHVRSWWNEDSYTDYMSDGVLIDITAPKLVSTGAIECLVEIQNSSQINAEVNIDCSWEATFFDQESGISHYEVSVLEYPNGKILFDHLKSI